MARPPSCPELGGMVHTDITIPRAIKDLAFKHHLNISALATAAVVQKLRERGEKI